MLEDSINILKTLFTKHDDRSTLTKQFEDIILDIKMSLLMPHKENPDLGFVSLTSTDNIIKSDFIFRKLTKTEASPCKDVSDCLMANNLNITFEINASVKNSTEISHKPVTPKSATSTPPLILSEISIQNFTPFSDIKFAVLSKADRFDQLNIETLLTKTAQQFHHYNGFLDMLDLEFNKNMIQLTSLMTFVNNIADATNCLIYIKDTNGKYVAVNALYAQFIGAKQEDIIGKTTEQIAQLDNLNTFYAYDHNVSQLQPSFASGFAEVKDTCGDKHQLQFFKLAFSSNQVNKQLLFSIAFADTSTHTLETLDNTNQKTHVSHISHIDPLTKLPNRILFNERLQQSLIHARRTNTTVCILLIDLDEFKRINDTLGHTQGDKLLKIMAGRLMECVRETDIIARMGGDEFAIVLTNLNYSEISTVIANKILNRIAEPITIDGHDLVVTTSIGVTFYPEDGDNIDSLISNADAAMYLAKSEGKNNFQYFSSSMNEISFERLMIESNIRKSIRNNDFVIYLQPRIHTQQETIESAEVLLRWNHPELGIISPGKFIPVAEDTGLIIEIGNWLFEHVAQTLKGWIDRGIPPCKLSINLSPKQFRQKDLMAVILKSFEQHDIDKKLIELEITESTAMKNPMEANDILHKITAEGIQISIDDFGTGYSSLSYLKKFPIHCLKIDRSFIKDIPHDSDDVAITKSIISFSKALNLKVVAEGVETKDQVDFLKSENCDEIQGFYFYKPMPVNSFEKLLIRKSQKK